MSVPTRLDGRAAAGPVAGHLTGWRLFQYSSDGSLTAPFASLAPHVRPSDVRWRPGWNTARCLEPRRSHRGVPGPSCECGLRVVPNLADLHRMLHRMATYERRSPTDVALDLGVFARVLSRRPLYGPSPNDPAGTRRTREARLVEDDAPALYLAPWLAADAGNIADRYDVTVSTNWESVTPG